LDPGELAGWPPNRWELSAAESYALLYGPKSSKPSQPFKLAVLELVSRRVLEMIEVQKSGLFRTKKVALLRTGEGTTDNQVLLAVRDLYFTSAKSVYPDVVSGVEVKSLAERASQQYSSRKGFAEAVVMKALEEQGFYRRERRSFLGIIPYEHWALSRSGEAAREQLKLTMRLGESQFGRWVDREPNRALAYLGLVGPAILLMELLHPDIQRLREVQDRTGDGGGSSGTSAESQGEQSSGQDAPESGNLELDICDFDLDFDVLGDLGGTFDAIDSGVDAGGGDGGDGGGNGGD
jgi:hypothetical protein